MRCARSIALALLAGSSLAVLGGPAGAADMRPILKAPPAPVVVVPPWAGFYFGVHGGYGYGHKKWYDNFPFPDLELDADTKVKGGLGGLQAGFNLPIFYNLIIGAEADFSWAKVRSEHSCFSFGDQICTSESEWFATVTGRLGAVFGPLMLFVKAGVAWTRDHFTNVATTDAVSDGIPSLPGVSFIGYDRRVGSVIGFGLEYFLTASWSAKVEFNRMDFGQRSVNFYSLEDDFFTEEVRQRVDVVKVGVNYRFDVPGAVPVAVPAAKGIYKAPVAAVGAEPYGTAYAFAGADTSRRRALGWAGALIAPTDIDQSGPRVFILGSSGAYSYDEINGVFYYGEALVGYGFHGDTYAVNLYVGGNAETHHLSQLDPENSVVGTQFGAKVRGDVWLLPTPQTLAVLEGDYSTAFRSWSILGKVGYDFFGNGSYFGPEASFFGNERYQQWRVGAHVSRLVSGRFEAAVAGGYADDSTVGASAYGRLDLSYKF
jgi:hypothetical protein